jgi:transmembrane sensor
MNEPRPAPRQEEAARWFAALRRGVMSLEERAAYDSWRRDRLNRAAFAELEQSWESLDALREHLIDTGTDAAASKTPPRFGRPALVAAMCALSLVIGVLSYSAHSSFWTTLDWTDR